jgi:RNA polymerase sigma-70 factor (ECF subfamily)
MDHRLFLKLFLPGQPLLKAYLLAATGDLHAAEDLFQEVSCALWEQFDRYDPGRPFRAWALGMARIEVLRWRQKRARSRVTLSDDALAALAETAAEQAAEPGRLRDLLRACLDRLGGTVRDIVRLKYLDALPIARVAEKLGKSVAAVEMALVRARRALRECVESGPARTGGTPT